MRSPILEVRDAEVRLGGRRVWSDVTLRVERQELVAVLGPNGSGKSTLMRAVLGLVGLSAGSIRVLGAPPGRHNRQIGYLPQRRSFDPGARVRGRDIVRLGLDGARWGTRLPFADRLARRAHGEGASDRVAAMLELVGATGYADRSIGEVSGGEQQRLLIAQALVSGPRLLILDEPLDSLDLANQQGVAALVQRVCREQGVTVLLVVHDVNPVLGYLDRVLYLGAGQAVMGRPEEVMTSDTLSRLYETDVEVLRASDGRLVVVGQPDAPAPHGVHPGA